MPDQFEHYADSVAALAPSDGADLPDKSKVCMSAPAATSR